MEINGARWCKEDGNTNSSSPKTKRAVASKHWCFTFNNYTEKDITDILKRCNGVAGTWVFQEEIGKKGTKHLQGYIKFKKRVRPKYLFSDKIHWERTRNIKASMDYCSKSDTACGRVWKHGKIPEPLEILRVEQLYDWQLKIIDIIKRKPNDRAIHWFWEQLGNIGKSVFCKYLCAEYDAIILSGKASDMKYSIIKYHEKHSVYPRLIVLDIPRSYENYISYTGIEEVKNGCFHSSKYECDMVLMNSPHIVIFANFEPNYDKLSEDRWKVTNLRNECDSFTEKYRQAVRRAEYDCNLDEGLPEHMQVMYGAPGVFE